MRTRLTLWYGLVFFAGGAVLIAITYLLVSNSLAANRPEAVTFEAPSEDSVEPGTTSSHSTEPLPDPSADSIERFRVGGSAVAGESLPEELEEQTTLSQRATMRDLLTFSLLALGFVGVAAVGVGWWMAGRALRPLHQVTATARRVADRRLHERIALAGPQDEIRELADTFDDMLERLDHAFDSQRRFVANASHELRTPLAINRGLIELATADADPQLHHLGSSLLTVNQRQERLIDALLVLARSERQIDDPRPVELSAVIARSVDDIADEATEREVSVRSATTPLTIEGDETLLEQLVSNLVRNGVRHNHAGGWVGIELSSTDEEPILTVSNTGPTVTSDELPALFAPFRRAGDDRTSSSEGSGLGLSIVSSVAHAHGGDVDAEPRAGGGLTIRVRLAARPDS